jgi:hypothetical protein
MECHPRFYELLDGFRGSRRRDLGFKFLQSHADFVQLLLVKI